MTKYWFITGDFLADRSRRIGASDIPALIPNPERPTESLAGYGRTPVTVWEEKTGRRDRDPAGLPAEMGHYLEQKAIELFIRDFAGYEIAKAHIHDRQAFEFTRDANAGNFQNTAFRHHVQVHRDGMICHPDCIYDPSVAYIPKPGVAHGVRVKFEKPFIVEAKSANHWSAWRPEGSIVKGYDVKLKSWQGIPLAHYMQIQFQLALLEIDTAYLTLIHDTSNHDVWEIRANHAHQGKLIDLAGAMAHRIETDTPPADLALNAKDIMALYPDVGDDFVIVTDDERDKAVEIAREYRRAESQQKRWKEKTDDAKDAMAVMLKDRPEIRDADGIIAKWQKRSGSERIVALSEIKETNPVAYRYLKKRNLISKSTDTRTVKISWKGDEE